MNQPLKLGMYCPNFAETYSFLRLEPASPTNEVAKPPPDSTIASRLSRHNDAIQMLRDEAREITRLLEI